MDDRITILDDGRTLSLRFGDQAHEIVAESSSEAIEALAKMLFEEHARAEQSEQAWKRTLRGIAEAVVQGTDEITARAEKLAEAGQAVVYQTRAIIWRDAKIAESLQDLSAALATDEPSKKETT